MQRRLTDCLPPWCGIRFLPYGNIKRMEQQGWRSKTLPSWEQRLRAVLRPEIGPDASPQARWEAKVEGPPLAVSIIFILLFVWTSIDQRSSWWITIADLGM